MKNKKTVGNYMIIKILIYHFFF